MSELKYSENMVEYKTELNERRKKKAPEPRKIRPTKGKLRFMPAAICGGTMPFSYNE